MKQNVFYDAFKGALNGYTDLVNALMLPERQAIIESDVELQANNDYEKHWFTDRLFEARCFDGLAVASCHDMNVMLKYPKMEDLTVDQMNDCLTYRGLPTITSFDAKTNYDSVHTTITFGDVMVRFGEVYFIHHKK